jgi:hypothetical protein
MLRPLLHGTARDHGVRGVRHFLDACLQEHMQTARIKPTHVRYSLMSSTV